MIERLTLNNVVRARAHGTGALQDYVEHSHRAIGGIDGGCISGNADGKTQLLARVHDADGTIVIQGVVGGDALAGCVEDSNISLLIFVS